MKKKISPTLIGAFVVGAIALTVAALLVFGSGEFMKKKLELVAYFEGSVKGLNAGAPVILRGVNIGKVTEIQLLGDQENNTFEIAVFMEIYPERITMQRRRDDLNTKQKIDMLVQLGLRAQLETQSFITNMMMVVFKMQPDKPAVLRALKRDKRHIEIPTVKSAIQELMDKMETLPIDEIMTSIRETLQGIDRMVNSPEIKESVAALRDTMLGAKKLVNHLDKELGPLSASVQDTLGDARKLVRNVDAQVDPLAGNIGETLRAARAAIARAETAMESIENTTREDSSLIYGLTEALQQLSETARALRALADYLDRHPEGLLRGKLGSKGE
jgi:paraquat-inducible protein B